MEPGIAQVAGVRPELARFAAPLERIDNLWEVPGTLLRGRERELDQLRCRFSEIVENGAGRQPHVIWGEAGMGKSALARQIADDVAPYYRARWWVDGSDELRIRVGLREFARRLGIPSANPDSSSGSDDATETHRFLGDLREFLQMGTLGGRALVVLDNVDDAALKHSLTRAALRYLPASACDVLITSQASHWYPVAPSDTRLKGLEAASGAELIAGESGRLDLAVDEDVREIARIFGGRPLFLRQVASLLRDGDAPGDFRRRLAESAEDALEILPGVEGFAPLWRTTYAMSIARVEGARPGAGNLLKAMSFLSPDAMPLHLLHALAEEREGWRAVHVDAALAALADRSLVERQLEGGTRTYSLHRIVGALLRAMAREERVLPDALGRAVSAVSRATPRREGLSRVSVQRTMAVLAPHVEAIAHHVLENQKNGVDHATVERAAEASSILGLYHRTASEWIAAEEASRRAVALSDPSGNPGAAALRQVRLANIMRQRALFEQAEELVNTALPQLRKTGTKSDFAWALTVQARILRHRPSGSPVEALQLLYQALQLMSGSEKEGDPSALRQLSELHGYLSVMNRQLSKLDAAEAEATEGLRIITGGMLPDEALAATDLPEEALLATHLRALGGVWRLRGDLGRAIRAQRRALEVFERVYGSDHTDVCRALDSLGRVEREWGDFEAAVESFARAKRISDLQFGPNHAHAGTALVNLALTYLELRDPLRALADAEEGLRIYRSAYHEQHTDDSGGVLRNEATVWALFVRANALAELGRLRQAREDHATVLAWREAHYPRLHAHIASSHYALGDLHWKADGGDGSKDLALDHHRHALAIREQVFGRSPNYWLALSQARVGVLTGDKELVGAALATFEAQLMPGHWRSVEAGEALARLSG
jgi:tetratricopeptide (TPR) repeat protein